LCKKLGDEYFKLGQHRGVPCRPSCKERGKLWKQELSSLTTLVGAMASILSVIAPKMLAGMQCCGTVTIFYGSGSDF
jgi:hypothetical protein